MAKSTKKNKPGCPDWKKIQASFQQNIPLGESESELKEMEIELNLDICPDCNQFKQELEEGKLICDCGIIYPVLDTGPEWRFYTENGDPDISRCGMPISTLLPESSYHCAIMASGGKMSEQMYRMKQKNNEISDSHRENTLYKQFNYIRQAGLPEKINQDACILYKKYMDSNKKYLRKDNRDGLVMGAVYRALEENGVPRSTQEVANLFHVPLSVVTNGYKKIPHPERTTSTPFSFIERYCSKLKIPEIYTKLCEFVCIKLTQNMKLMECSPTSVATGVVYWVGHSVAHLPDITKKHVADELDVSIVTINKIHNKLEEMRAELLPSDFC